MFFLLLKSNEYCWTLRFSCSKCLFENKTFWPLCIDVFQLFSRLQSHYKEALYFFNDKCLPNHFANCHQKGTYSVLHPEVFWTHRFLKVIKVHTKRSGVLIFTKCYKIVIRSLKNILTQWYKLKDKAHQ